MATLREIPYPFSTLWALSNDADSWQDSGNYDIFEARHSAFAALGLELGDSIYYSEALCGANGGTYADKADKYIRCGWIDAIHLWSEEFTPTRAEVLAAHAHFVTQGYSTFVSSYLDHGFYGSPDYSEYLGIGRQFVATHRAGDSPSGVTQHADVTTVSTPFVWAGDYCGPGEGYEVYPKRVHPDGGGFTVSVANFLYASDLRDGSPAWFFDRWGDTNNATQVSDATIATAITEGGVLIKYAESGWTDIATWGGRLKAAQDAGDLLLSSSFDVLRYCRVWQGLQWSENDHVINVTGVLDSQFGNYTPTLEDLRGITFMVPNAELALIKLDGVTVEEADIIRGTDNSVGVRWHPYDVTDYSAETPTPNIVDVQSPFQTVEYANISLFDFLLSIPPQAAVSSGITVSTGDAIASVLNPTESSGTSVAVGVSDAVSVQPTAAVGVAVSVGTAEGSGNLLVLFDFTLGTVTTRSRISKAGVALIANTKSGTTETRPSRVSGV